MIDPKHNSSVLKADDLIAFIVKATDVEDVFLLFGRAHGYLEALRDAKVLPRAAFENLEKRLFGNFNTVNERLGLNARQPRIVAPAW